MIHIVAAIVFKTICMTFMNVMYFEPFLNMCIKKVV
jgi:hypothetical protein